VLNYNPSLNFTKYSLKVKKSQLNLRLRKPQIRTKPYWESVINFADYSSSQKVERHESIKVFSHQRLHSLQ